MHIYLFNFDIQFYSPIWVLSIWRNDSSIIALFIHFPMRCISILPGHMLYLGHLHGCVLSHSMIWDYITVEWLWLKLLGFNGQDLFVQLINIVLMLLFPLNTKYVLALSFSYRYLESPFKRCSIRVTLRIILLVLRPYTVMIMFCMIQRAFLVSMVLPLQHY